MTSKASIFGSYPAEYLSECRSDTLPSADSLRAPTDLVQRVSRPVERAVNLFLSWILEVLVLGRPFSKEFDILREGPSAALVLEGVEGHVRYIELVLTF